MQSPGTINSRAERTYRWYSKKAAVLDGGLGGFRALAVTDGHGDGYDDIFYVKDGLLGWCETDGTDDGIDLTPEVDPTIFLPAWGTNWVGEVVAVGDFDGDAYGDLFYSRYGYMFWYESDGAGNIVAVPNQQITWGGGTSYAAAAVVGDFDHDAGNDLLVAKNGAVSWWEANGDDSRVYIQNFNSLAGVQKMVLGDLDGDTNPDWIIIGTAASGKVLSCGMKACARLMLEHGVSMVVALYQIQTVWMRLISLLAMLTVTDIMSW